MREGRSLECPEYPDRVFFCQDDDVGGENIRGDTGPQGNVGPRGSSKIPQSIVLNQGCLLYLDRLDMKSGGRDSL